MRLFWLTPITILIFLFLKQCLKPVREACRDSCVGLCRKKIARIKMLRGTFLVPQKNIYCLYCKVTLAACLKIAVLRSGCNGGNIYCAIGLHDQSATPRVRAEHSFFTARIAII